MKRILCAVLSVLLIVTLFSACGSKNGNTETESAVAGNDTEKTDDGAMKIITTIFPIYDWTRKILGDKAETADLHMLLDSGADLHNFQPTMDDMMQISTCDVFIYVGGESDKWVDDVLATTKNEKLIAVNLMDALGDSLKEEELKEGMEAEEEEEEEEGPAYDEHIWLSLQNAAALCDVIAAKLGEADAENASLYKANAEAYLEKINALDADYQAAIEVAQTKTLLFADRFPFRYLTADYNLDYYAAFMGCSAETEVSFDTVKFLAGKLDELGLKYVCTLTGGDGRIAETVIGATEAKDQTVLQFDSMQNVTADDVANGADYLAIMQSNLDVLKTALS